MPEDIVAECGITAGASLDCIKEWTFLPGLNESVDAFLVKALEHNLPITFANHAEGPHAFDLEHDSETSREIVRQILTFMTCRLRG